jgi:HK97 gp10 family phage protein
MPTSVHGIRELRARLQDVLSEEKLRQSTGALVQEVADKVRDRMRSNARAAGWPSSIIPYVFAVSDDIARGKIRALAGVSKGGKNKTHPMYREWRAGKHPKSPKAKVSPGGKVGMGWPTMWEFGTSRQPARPAIGPAITSMKKEISDMMATGLRKIMRESGIRTGRK